jgi:ribosomal protein S18 acetylase RimI-like enzyme
MTSLGDLRPVRVSDSTVRIARLESAAPALYRRLYEEVGHAHHWVDRLGWTDEDILQHVADPRLSVYALYVGDEIAGYFELKREAADVVEIAYFGLMPSFIGRGLGGHLLTDAVERAFASGARRVWLHTSTLDHAHALGNYLSRGFRIVRTETYET